jgi:DNA (cytosine-5)-methyltransferase 1
MSLTIGSLFSGIGGLELGLERAGLGPVKWQVEINPFCRQVLAKHWPEVARFNDIELFARDGYEPSSVDLICGGFPCQPFSTASRGRRVAKDLWPEMLRVILAVRPRFAIVENVARDAVEVCASQLARRAYTCIILDLSAGMVGAPHERPRWFLVAHANGNREQYLSEHVEMAGIPHLAGALSWAAPPERVGMDDGLPDRMDRLRALGNSVVPQCAEVVGHIVRELAGLHLPTRSDKAG